MIRRVIKAALALMVLIGAGVTFAYASADSWTAPVVMAPSDSTETTFTGVAVTPAPSASVSNDGVEILIGAVDNLASGKPNSLLGGADLALTGQVLTTHSIYRETADPAKASILSVGSGGSVEEDVDIPWDSEQENTKTSGSLAGFDILGIPEIGEIGQFDLLGLSEIGRNSIYSGNSYRDSNYWVNSPWEISIGSLNIGFLINSDFLSHRFNIVEFAYRVTRDLEFGIVESTDPDWTFVFTRADSLAETTVSSLLFASEASTRSGESGAKQPQRGKALNTQSAWQTHSLLDTS